MPATLRRGSANAATHREDGVRRIREVEVTTPPVSAQTTVAREYVYGPGYVDELVAQVADDDNDPLTPAETYWYFQDANYSVVAVLDAAGEVLLQYGYEPYGVVVAADDRTAVGVDPPTNRAGHQGLYFERIYLVGILTLDPALAIDPAANRGAIGLHYNRNRWYSPELGRFTTPDPNASATPIIVACVGPPKVARSSGRLDPSLKDVSSPRGAARMRHP